MARCAKQNRSPPGPDALTPHIDYTRELFTLLDIDFHHWPRVTVAGSKGKGSTAVLLASLLQASGEHVGLISSPEMRRFNERIRIDGTCVSDEMLIQAAHHIAPAVRTLISRIQPPHYLGPGGVVLTLAATLFAQTPVSAIVIEAGRGGEYDEARLVEANVSVLTPHSIGTCRQAWINGASHRTDESPDYLTWQSSGYCTTDRGSAECDRGSWEATSQ